MNNFLKIVNDKGIEKLPFMPCFDDYAKSGLPEKYREQHVIDLQVQFESDMLRGVEAYKETFKSPVKYKKERKGEYETEIYETPIGNLKRVARFMKESPFIPFPTEYLIKSTEDLKIFRYVLENTIVEEDFSRMEHYMKKYPGKIMSASMQDSPFYDLLTKQVGIENFTFLFMEDPTELELTMEAMMETKKQYLDLSAKSPADVVICYENTNTANSMPDWIKAYGFKFLNEFADIAHKYDTPLLIHMCGKISLLLEEIAECKFDGIIDISPPPTGDIDFAKAIKVMEKAEKMIIGGIECNQFIMKDTEDFTKSVEKFLETLPESPYFFLGSGDAVPQGVSFENMKAATDITKKRPRVGL